METKYNPKGLKIGDKVRVCRTCTVEYDEVGNKNLMFSEYEPFDCYVVGSVKKALGTYVKGDCLANFLEAVGYTNPPYLKVSKYVWLYECRLFLTGKAFYVYPGDINACS